MKSGSFSVSEPPIKITFIGDAHVGKSSLVLRLTQERFSENTGSTIGAAFCTLRFKSRLYHIWDTAGQERYGSLVPLYLSGAAIIVIVYDISSRVSFERLTEYWIPFIRRNLRLGEDEAMPMLYLLGNKSDLGNKLRQVSKSEGEEFAKEHGMGFQESSAKTGDGSSTILTQISKHVEDLILTQADNVRLTRDEESIDTPSFGAQYCGGGCPLNF